MLPKKNRISKDRDFAVVFKKSRPVFTKDLAFRVVFKNTTETRVAFIVSNKVDKRATVRNTLKRRLRAMSTELISRMKKGYDVVVTVKPSGGALLEYPEIKDQFNEGIVRTGLITQ